MNSKILDYETPASEWAEGLPLGNGTIGAMFFGPAGKEQLTLNHDRLFRKKIVKDLRTAHLIPKMRELVLAGKTLEADKYFLDNFQEITGNTNPFQVFGELRFDIPSVDSYRDYRRSLDLSEGLARISYISNATKYAYETFVSKNDDALMVKLNAHNLNCALQLNRTLDDECELAVDYDNGRIIMTGRFVEGVSFASVAGIEILNGKCSWQDGRLVIQGAERVVIRQVFSTSYTAADPLADCLHRITPVCDKSYEQVKSAHSKENQRLFDRVSFELDGADPQKTTGQGYNDIYDKQYIDTALYVQLFNMGRYCLMSASRPGSYPMNLQGIWNDSIAPMWESGHTMDMNIQMQYWCAQSCNLSECELPVFRWLHEARETLERQAKNILGTRGYYIPQYTDAHMTPACQKPYAMFQLLWISGAAWMAQHYYEYWKFTGDDEFLEKTAYPYLKQCAYVYKDYLVKNTDGKYVCAPSYSPENMTEQASWSVNTATMDITIIHELLAHLMEIDDYLKLHDTDRAWWEEINGQLPDYPFDQDGNLKEWIDDYEVQDPYHRHISHIYGIFPGKLFSPEKDQRLFEAAVKAIYKRREGGFRNFATWSHAWFACCFARIRHGDEALESIDYLMKSGMCSNFLTLHNDWRDQGYTGMMIGYKLIQIEALLGVTAAIAEMFVQSFEDGIMILPSLPAQWSGGKMTGLRAYGGFEISVEWKDGKLKELTITSHNGGVCVLNICRPFCKAAYVKDQSGKVMQKIGTEKVVFDTIKGNQYILN